MTITIIPAAAGYFGLWRADNDRGYGRSPIVAWCMAVGDAGDLIRSAPVIDGELGPDVVAILCPDGSVNKADGGEWWETITDWAGVRQ